MRALSLGVKSRDPGTFRGQKFDGYFSLSYAIFSEIGEDSRRLYAEGDLKKKVIDCASEFGQEFLMSGEISAKGTITVTDIKPATGFEE